MNHKDLEAWKKGIDLVEQVYMQTKLFPKERNILPYTANA